MGRLQSNDDTLLSQGSWIDITDNPDKEAILQNMNNYQVVQLNGQNVVQLKASPSEAASLIL